MNDRSAKLCIFPIAFKQEVRHGDSIAAILIAAMRRGRVRLQQGDILVVKHKIISKAEGQFVELERIRPTVSSRQWARRYRLDPRVIQLALRESRRIVRRQRGVLITQTRHGLVCANSGVDVSNVDGGGHALLLPADPDRSAARLRADLKKRLNLSIPVIITDTFGRPWREGLTEVAIGVAGLRPLHDDRGRTDPHGYALRVSLEAVADELACAGGLVCSKLSRTPACIIRGFPYRPGPGRARDLVRPAAGDLFR